MLPMAWTSRPLAKVAAPSLRLVQRGISSTQSTISDRDIARLAARPLHPLTLGDLVKHGRPPLSASSLYQSANFALSVLPARLAHRIQSLRNLPFIVVTNPHVSQIHENYMHSLSTLLPLASHPINSPEDEDRFTEVMAGLVHTHSDTIPILARGFLESRKYIAPDAVTKFLDEHLRARIGTRLLAEQHIALHYSSLPYLQRTSSSDTPQPPTDSTYIGIIDTALKPALVVRHCESFVSDICEFRYGVRPTVVINGEPETQIAQIPVHLEYIITELLKNAFRATIESGHERDPIEVTIAPAFADTVVSSDGISLADQGERRSATKSTAEIRPFEKSTPGVTIRIRDRGGGISPDILSNIWNYSFTTFDEREAMDASGIDALNVISDSGAGQSSIAGLGYGLPLGRAYAEYFGGGIALQSLFGYGTDVYLSLRGIGSMD